MNRHVLITGAARGIGRQIARRFGSCRDTNSVTLVDRHGEELASAAAALRQEVTATVRTDIGDLRDPEAAQQVIDQAWAATPIDVLVNAAGIYPATPFLSLDADTWDQVQNINVRAPLLLTVALANHARRQSRKPCVVNITSGAALRARPGAAPYSTSKAALEMVTKASALELGELGIRVNAVSPGFVTVDSPVNPITSGYADAVSKNPLGRRGEPDDIARAVLWLASEEADWVTGETIRVDGGASAGAMDLPLHWDEPMLGADRGEATS